MNRIVSFIAKRFFPIWYARRIGVRVGENCRLINVSYSTEPYLITLGNHVSVTLSHFETHDGGVWAFRNENPEIDVVKPISVGDNVFIGYGSIILPGTRIGSNVVVGARSVVSGVIPDNVVIAGVPARVIKSLYEYKDKAIKSGNGTAKMTCEQKRAFYKDLFKNDKK
jgi:acetyltransferase-like isoleucine patch superfamily enzyme